MWKDKSLWDGQKEGWDILFTNKTAMSEVLGVQLCTATLHNHASQEVENIIL